MFSFKSLVAATDVYIIVVYFMTILHYEYEYNLSNGNDNNNCANVDVSIYDTLPSIQLPSESQAVAPRELGKEITGKTYVHSEDRGCLLHLREIDWLVSAWTWFDGSII